MGCLVGQQVTSFLLCALCASYSFSFTKVTEQQTNKCYLHHTFVLASSAVCIYNAHRQWIIRMYSSDAICCAHNGKMMLFIVFHHTGWILCDALCQFVRPLMMCHNVTLSSVSSIGVLRCAIGHRNHYDIPCYFMTYDPCEARPPFNRCLKPNSKQKKKMFK